jgi:ATP synthase F1 gamma subunit
MRRVKKSVLNSREFLVDLNNTFRAVTYAYEEYLKRVSRYKETGELLNKNGKDVLVFVSANMGLYGDIIRKTFKPFKEEVLKSNDNTDIIIIGRVGLEMYKNSELSRPYTYYDLSDSGSDIENLKSILAKVLDYSQILVFHGLFKSVLSQVPTKTLVTGEAANLEDTYEKEGSVMFLFEPSVEKIADYFEREVLSSVFEQTIFESNLSKFSSRMVSLYSSTDNIRNSLKRVDFALKKFNHKVFNSKQISRLSSVYLWNS